MSKLEYDTGLVNQQSATNTHYDHSKVDKGAKRRGIYTSNVPPMLHFPLVLTPKNPTHNITCGDQQ